MNNTVVINKRSLRIRNFVQYESAVNSGKKEGSIARSSQADAVKKEVPSSAGSLERSMADEQDFPFSSQAATCEVVWDCVSPTSELAENALHRTVKRTMDQCTPKRSLETKAKKTSHSSSGVPKTRSRILFKKVQNTQEQEDFSDLEDMDVIHGLSPIEQLVNDSAELTNDEECSTLNETAPKVPDSPPNLDDGSPLELKTPIRSLDDPSKAKMNQSFSCQKNGEKFDSFGDDDDLFNESVMRSTQAIEDALFDKSKNKFISPAAIKKVMSKLNFNKETLKVTAAANNLASQKASTPQPSRNPSILQPSRNPSSKQNLLQSCKQSLNGGPEFSSNISSSDKSSKNHSVQTCSDKSETADAERIEEPKFKFSDRGNSKHFSNASVGSTTDNFKQSYNNITKDANKYSNKLKQVRSSRANQSPLSRSSLTDKLPRSKSTAFAEDRKSAPKTRSPALKSPSSSGVRRFNSDSFIDFNDEDSLFEEIASSIPDDENMLKSWASEFFNKKTLDKMEGSKKDELDGTKKKRMESFGESSCMDSLQSRSTTVKPANAPVSKKSDYNTGDVDLFDDDFDMDDNMLDFISQVEADYLTQQSQDPSATLPHPTSPNLDLLTPPHTSQSSDERNAKTTSKDTKTSEQRPQKQIPNKSADNRPQTSGYSLRKTPRKNYASPSVTKGGAVGAQKAPKDRKRTNGRRN